MPPICVAGTSILLSGVSSCSGTAGGGLHNAPEGSSGTCGPTWSGYLQLAVPSRAGDGGGGGGGGWRPVIDLLALNGFVTLTKFQMETMASVFGSIWKGDWMLSIDLKDAYFQIPVHPESRPFLRFCLEGWVYQFRALCFGLSMAPQVFTRVFALVSKWAHQGGVCLLRYLDDWLVIAKSRTLLLWHRDLVLQLCKDLGIIVNWEKSNLQPSTCVQYLGMLIDTSLEKVYPSQARLAHFLEVATLFLQLPSPQRTWQQLLGHMASLECFLPWGRSRMHTLQWHLKDHWFPMVDDLAVQIPLSQECVEAVRWWLQEDRWVSGVPLLVPVVAYRLVSVGLGSAPVGSNDLGGVVKGRKFDAHQCA